MRPRGARLADGLPARVLELVRREALWSPGDRVAVAVSGGVDSLVALVALAELRRAHGAELVVLSVDHGLRSESAAEVEQVGRVAAGLGLPFAALTLRLEPGPDLAARARVARRAALCAAAGPDVRIATGHHADDQAETVLQRLFSGSGAHGLSGLRPRAGAFVHPLIDEDRASIEAFAKLRGLAWIDDPSNARSQRGRLRAALAHALGRGPLRALARSAQLLAVDDACLDALATSALAGMRSGDASRLDFGALQALHPAVGSRVLRDFVAPSPLCATDVSRVLGWQGGGQRMRLADGRLLLLRAQALTLVDEAGGRDGNGWPSTSA